MNKSGEFKRRAVLTLIKSVPYSEVALYGTKTEKKTSYRFISKSLFSSCAQTNFEGYSIAEIDNAYDLFVKDNNVFKLIDNIAADYLGLNDDKDNKQLYYKDEKALGWRYISSKLGDDIFAAQFLSKKEKTKVNEKTWCAFIFSNKNDNAEYAENHFHLKASCRTLELNWVALMNYPIESKKCFEKLEYALAFERRAVSGKEDSESLYSKCMKAAAYRTYLWAEILGDSSIAKRILRLVERNEGRETERDTVTELSDIIGSLRIRYYSRKSSELDYIDLKWEKIPTVNIVCGYEYSGTKVRNVKEDYRVLLGERLLLMACFWFINNDLFGDLQKNIFYRYLIIRNDFREEMVQGNGVIGLKNFEAFQRRKGIFSSLKKCYGEEELPKMVLHGTIQRNIHYLEARIIPDSTPWELKKTIDNYLEKGECRRIDLPEGKDVFFVLHYPKRPEKKVVGKCRHYNYRRMLNIYCDNLKSVLKAPGINYYIRGIDSCSQEIGCRPEVFAPMFRDLLSYRFPCKWGRTENLHYLYATYHVGEDFLDLVDGLRSIDEVLLFCGYRKGCRLGHALALGLNPYEYYKLKKYSLCIPKQDYLDNLVWMYKRGQEFLLTRLVGNECFEKIKEEIAGLLKEIGYFKSLPDDTDIDNYYYAWQLRGDDPSLYEHIGVSCKKGWYIAGLTPRQLNSNSRIDSHNRDKAEVLGIVHDYFYKDEIYQKGSVCDVFEIDPKRIWLVELLQNCMIQYAEKEGIGIEANPSSNLEIGPISRYDEHPIIRLNTEGLITNTPGGRVCVSINTDDIGIFDTALENEYVIMRKAMEQSMNQTGDYLYHDVDLWIDNIRENGLKQAFKYDEMHD